MASEDYWFIFIAFCLALLVHYIVIELSHRKNLFLDKQIKVQRAHFNPTPRIGGLGIFFASIFIINDHTIGIPLLLSAIPVFFSGFIEDYSEKATPFQRLFIMALSPIMFLILLPDSLSLSLSTSTFFWLIYALIAFIFIIGISNGLNFIDGQNGLASGSALISFIGISILAFKVQDFEILYISLVLIASTLAFLIFNYPKGKIFLGDSGSYLLGFFLATVTILMIQRSFEEMSLWYLPILLIYPLWEVLFSTLRKVFFDKMSPFKSDRNHLHQLLYRNQCKKKGYLPSLLILPFQLTSMIICLFLPSNSIFLPLVFFVFAAVYCWVYWKQRMVILNLINKNKAFN